jgi:hypothetical protein
MKYIEHYIIIRYSISNTHMTEHKCNHYFVVDESAKEKFATDNTAVVKNCSNCDANYGKTSQDLYSDFFKNRSEKDLEKSIIIPHYHVFDSSGRCVYRLNSTTAKNGTMKGWKYTAPEKPGYGGSYVEIPEERICYVRQCI